MDKWRQVGLMATFMILLVLPGPVQTRDVKQDGLRPTMQAIFQALTTVFPLSLSDETFQKPANRQRIHEALQALANSAMQMTQHGQQASTGFDFLRQSLRDDAQKTLELFESDYFEESRFVLQHLTDNCFLCHSRLPSSRSFPLGKRFLEHMPMQQLDPLERMRLSVAARQFDAALASCEALLRSTAYSAAEIDLMALFEDYLRIAIRVHHDFPRAINTLETFRRRSDVPMYLADHLTAWMETLRSLQADTGQEHALSRARTLIQQGQRHNRYLADRQGLVYFLTASGLLHRYVDANVQPQRQQAEAYYLLGVAESYMPRTSWISETEFYLETAVRLAPTSPFGKKAFAFLEEYLAMGYSGALGLHLPSDVQKRLDDLRNLVNGLSVKK